MNNTQIYWAEKQKELVDSLDKDLDSMRSSWEEPLKEPLLIEPETKLKLSFFKKDRQTRKIKPVMIKNPIPFELAVETLREAFNQEDFIQSQLMQKVEGKDFVRENCIHSDNCHEGELKCLDCRKFSFRLSAIQRILGSDKIKLWTIV